MTPVSPRGATPLDSDTNCYGSQSLLTDPGDKSTQNCPLGLMNRRGVPFLFLLYRIRCSYRRCSPRMGAKCLCFPYPELQNS